MPSRSDALARLAETSSCDVLIIGGGINGAATFRDLARQGLSCVIVDAVDFGAGASSASTRMAHGGLRYLETGQLRLVAESTRERDRLLVNAAHYVKPIEVTIPLFSVVGGVRGSFLKLLGRETRLRHRGLLLVKTGLSIYDFLSRRSRALSRHRISSARSSLKRFPGLHPSLRGCATYYDAAVSHAERVALELVSDGLSANHDCIAVNHCAVEGLEDGAVTLRDGLDGSRYQVTPRIAVNAGGAWIDRANARLGVTSCRISGTKGSHLVITNDVLRAALDGSAFSWDDGNGRMCIMYPIGGSVLLGSTDIRVDDPDRAVCEQDEVDYLLAAVRLIFPWIDVREDEIRFRFCGVRPLVYSDAQATVNISRDHAICEEAPGAGRPFPVLSLVGGKWTTFRAFAEEATDRALALIGRGRTSSTVDLPVGGARGLPADAGGRRELARRTAERTGLVPDRVEELLDRYGTRGLAIAEACAAQGDEPLPDALDYSRREIAWLVSNEMAVSLGDVFFRRTIIAISGRLSDSLIVAVADILDEVLGRTSLERARDQAAFARELEDRHGVRLPSSAAFAPAATPAEVGR